MRLLQALRVGREEVRAATGHAAPPPPPPLEDAQLAATQAIGERQERFRGDLDAIARIVAHLQQLGPLVEGLREPLMVEFEAFRRDHADLLAARAQIDSLAASERALREVEQALKLRLNEAARNGERDGAELEELRASLASVLVEAASTREALAQAVAANEDQHATGAAASLVIQRLEEDASVLRSRVDQGADRQREQDGLIARTRQDADLAEAENAALRDRLDELVQQLAHAARGEAQLQADLGAERERAAAQLAQAERANREALAHTQILESQLVGARGQAANLSARMEAGAARSAKLEHLCRELSSKATAAMSHRQTMESLAGDNQTAMTRAAERIDQLERAYAELKGAYAALERERLAAVERGDQLASALQAQEAATARALDRGHLLEASLAEMADEEEHLRRIHDEETRQLSAEVRRVEAELQLSQAALHAARDHRSVAVA